MTVYVTVNICQGVVNDIQVFLTQNSAQETEQKWLQEHDIKNKVDRECKAQNGTELIIEKCEVKP